MELTETWNFCKPESVRTHVAQHICHNRRDHRWDRSTNSRANHTRNTRCQQSLQESAQTCKKDKKMPQNWMVFESEFIQLDELLPTCKPGSWCLPSGRGMLCGRSGCTELWGCRSRIRPCAPDTRDTSAARPDLKINIKMINFLNLLRKGYG